MHIGGLQKFSLSDFPSTPAAIIFTQGCNFRCPFCHNGSLLPMQAGVEGNEFEESEIIEWLASRTGKLPGVVITGGEPCLQADLPEFLGKIKALGYKVKLDSNGSFPDILEDVISKNLVDYIAMDIKADWDNYNRLCGVNVDIEKIQKSIEIIAYSGLDHQFRTTFVPALMGEDEPDVIKAFLPKTSLYKVQTFRPENALDPSLR